MHVEKELFKKSIKKCVPTTAVEKPSLASSTVKDAELDRQAEAICATELQRLNSASLSSPLPSSARHSPRTAREPLSPILVCNWMRRTGWEAFFANASRRSLITLYETPVRWMGPTILKHTSGNRLKARLATGPGCVLPSTRWTGYLIDARIQSPTPTRQYDDGL
ncbi:hypothetical protein BGZ63DRAFT_399716 [Mariannaea sp. PMI_226]|nr:hypothetical protein BGZ63DRAFT_399716 [Mariannaea sp. PMI_226]